MRRWTLGTVGMPAIMAALAVIAPSKSDAAMPVATPGQLWLVAGPAGIVEKVVLVCDPWTCYWRPGYPYYPYRAWRRHYWWGWQRPWWGWHRW